MLLSTEERDRLLAKLRQEWDWRSYYWYPLVDTSRRDVLAFDTQLLKPVLPEAKFKQLLAAVGAPTVYWCRELDPSQLISPRDLPLIYGGSESALFDESMSWVVYESHEGTVTFGGDPLISKVKAAVRNWTELQGAWSANND